MGKLIVYVGTYSEVLGHVPYGKGRGIELFEFDTETGALSPLKAQDGESFTPIWNSTWVTLHPTKPYLYAVEETDKFNGSGSVISYKIENSGKLTQINKVSSEGSYPCHASVDPTGKYLAAANYGSGNAALYNIDDNGSITLVHTVQHSGKSVNEQRQEGPHAHQALFVGDNLFVVDLGIDAAVQYKLVDGKLVLNPTANRITFPAGNGPRHVAFHPTDSVAFVAHELNSTLSLCSYDASSGSLKLIDTKSTKPAGLEEGSFPGEVEVSKNGKFVFVGNRGPDHIAVFKYSSNPAVFEAVGHVSTEGKHPRHFILSPDGKFLLVGNQNSDTIVTFKLDENTGSLQKVRTTNVATPACICFLKQ